MEWYWWVLIAVMLVAGFTLKLKILGKWMEYRKKRESQTLEEE